MHATRHVHPRCVTRDMRGQPGTTSPESDAAFFFFFSSRSSLSAFSSCSLSVSSGNPEIKKKERERPTFRNIYMYNSRQNSLYDLRMSYDIENILIVIYIPLHKSQSGVHKILILISIYSSCVVYK